MLIQRLHQPGKVEQAPGKPIHLVDHDAVDLPGLDVGEEALQGRTLHVSARVASIVVAVRQADPTLVLHGRDVGFAGFALGVEAVEVLVQPFLRGFARVDRAAIARFFRHVCRLPSQDRKSGSRSSASP